MLVRDVMNRNVIATRPDVKIKEAVKIMNKLSIGSLVVLDEKNNIVGIVTERDILKSIEKDIDPEINEVKDIMSKNVKTVSSDTDLKDAVDIMLKYKIKKLPVVDNGNLVGIITTSDIVVVEPKIIESIANLLSIKLPGYRGG
jgi:CBS domain-containing protein